MAHQGTTEGPITLISAPLDFNTSWIDLGPEIAVGGFNTIGVWLEIDINDSTDFRVRVLGKHTAAHTDECVLPIFTTSSTVIAVDDEYYEFTFDLDQKFVLSWSIDCLVPFVQVQISAGYTHTPPLEFAGQILDARLTLGSS
jgi:hypothetical protein